MRTFNDPISGYGDELQLYDVDVIVAGVSLPFILPNDFSLTLGHTYAAPYSFRGPYREISYSNTPAITFNKTIPLASGDILSISTGVNYAFSKGDTPQSSLLTASYLRIIRLTYKTVLLTT